MTRERSSDSQHDSFVLRVRILGGIFVLLALLIVVRLYFVQIVHGSEYREDAMGQYIEKVPSESDRGSIYFTDKSGQLVAGALMQAGWRIAIHPKDIDNATTTYKTLNTIVPIDSERFYPSAAKKSDPYEEIAYQITDDQAEQIRAKKMPGVLLVQDEWRVYPGHELAAQVVGFVGYQGSQRVGVYGLEREWQDTLAQKTSGKEMNPFAELFANAQALLSSDPAAHGGSIVTSLEPAVQRQLESTLDGVMKTYSPKIAGGIIMDSQTGAIIAMGVHPTFDPNAYNLVDDPSRFDDPLVEGRYEMGSIMKPLTMSIGVDTGSVTPKTTYKDEGCIMRSEKKICNYDGKARGVVSMQEILNQSLNTGATFVEEKVGSDTFTTYMKEFGLGDKTNIDLPNEIGSDIHALDNGSDVDYASASFGQGIAVTPIQMIRALSVLANHGLLVNPHLVTSIKYDNGISRPVNVPPSVPVLKPETAATVTDMLVQVVDKALVKGALKQEHYSIAAKTGTAQIANPKGGGYYSDRFLHSFFGYFPAHAPRYIIFLYAVEPHGAEFASATLANPFGDLEKFLVNYYQIPPDR